MKGYKKAHVIYKYIGTRVHILYYYNATVKCLSVYEINIPSHYTAYSSHPRAHKDLPQRAIYPHY